MKQEINLQINGQSEKILAEIIDRQIWFKIQDRVYSYDIIELSQSQFVKSKSSAKSADKIVAPMPGKITKVFVTEGQQIKKGHALVVMEAMKMEYTLKSDLDSVVEKINYKVGDQVALGTLLIQLKV